MDTPDASRLSSSDHPLGDDSGDDVSAARLDAPGVSYERAAFGAMGNVHIEHKPVISTHVGAEGHGTEPRVTQPIRLSGMPDTRVDYTKAAMGAMGDVHIEHKPETTIHQTNIHHNNVGDGGKHSALPWIIAVVCGLVAVGAVAMIMTRQQQQTIIVQSPVSPVTTVVDPKVATTPPPLVAPVAAPVQVVAAPAQAPVVTAQPPVAAPVAAPETKPVLVAALAPVGAPALETARMATGGGTAPAMARVSQAQLAEASLKQPFVNGLGMRFVPLTVQGRLILVCQHETRQRDYAAFQKEEAAHGVLLPQQPAASAGNDETLDLHPVVNVSLRDAKAFCDWLGAKEGIRYRLPTDFEWSTAVGIGGNEDPSRAADDKTSSAKGRFVWGTSEKQVPEGAGNFADIATKKAKPTGFREVALQHGIFDSYLDRYPTTAPVMRFKPTESGLYDLGGNALEWCVDQAKPDASQQPLRGGSWLSGYHKALGAADREFADSDKREATFGFRCVIEID